MFETLFCDSISQIACDANGMAVELREVAVSAKLSRLKITALLPGSFCVKIDVAFVPGDHRIIHFFGKAVPGVHKRCDYALFIPVNNGYSVWLIDMKSSHRGACDSLVQFRVTELLLKALAELSVCSEIIQKPPRLQFRFAAIFPTSIRPRRTNTTRAENPVVIRDGVYFWKVELTGGSATMEAKYLG